VHSPFHHDTNAAFPSSYADGGFVQWTTARMQENGNMIVRFPKIRWNSLRATEGWAALQYHSLLHSTFTVYPPSGTVQEEREIPKLEVNLLRGSFFAIFPFNSFNQGALEWHAGNIYEDFGGQTEAIIDLLHLAWDEPTCFHILVSGDYEVDCFIKVEFTSAHFMD
jgi:hypothetical protein